MSIDDYEAIGYERVRVLPNGETAGLLRMIFTVGLVVGLDEFGYRTRFCYPDFNDAAAALESWDGIGDPPGPWIKEKGRGAERLNPSTFKGIPIRPEAGNDKESGK